MTFNRDRAPGKSWGICSVATNIYCEFWREMVLSADRVLNSNHEVVFHVFTNKVDFCKAVQDDLKHVQVRVHEIPNLEWPRATLDRYSLICQFQKEFTEDFILHMDADMYIHQDFLAQFESKKLMSDVALVSHPGYWRKNEARFRKGLSRQKIKDVIRILRLGGLGDWETNRNSLAFVERRLRKVYVCGGVWFGKRSAIIEMCEELSFAIEKDFENNLVARWHDESHINKWATQHQFDLLDPAFCFSTNYVHLNGLDMYIEAVNKNPLINASKAER